ncbi:nucleotidyltransferase domain-containing protein [Candidatus Pacearchaeota archaeon]|nr:nucleotidyltransferase domain-containing protein [Candidatus Pacearchaeota archaeon]
MAKKKLSYKEIMKKLEEHKNDICKYGVRKIGLFGSFLRNKQKRGSDIDILVSFDRVTFDNYIGLKFLLEKILRREVDLVIEKDLRSELNYVKDEVRYARL